MKNLNRIKNERCNSNRYITITYNKTGYLKEDEWVYDHHEQRPIHGDQLQLIRRWRRRDGYTQFLFAVYDRTEDMCYTFNEKKTLQVWFSHCFGEVTGILYYEKTLQEIRKEKLFNFLNPKPIDPEWNVLRL